jgi:hypothetical protein
MMQVPDLSTGLWLNEFAQCKAAFALSMSKSSDMPLAHKECMVWSDFLVSCGLPPLNSGLFRWYGRTCKADGMGRHQDNTAAFDPESLIICRRAGTATMPFEISAGDGTIIFLKELDPGDVVLMTPAANQQVWHAVPHKKAGDINGDTITLTFRTVLKVLQADGVWDETKIKLARKSKALATREEMLFALGANEEEEDLFPEGNDRASELPRHFAGGILTAFLDASGSGVKSSSGGDGTCTALCKKTKTKEDFTNDAATQTDARTLASFLKTFPAAVRYQEFGWLRGCRVLANGKTGRLIEVRAMQLARGGMQHIGLTELDGTGHNCDNPDWYDLHDLQLA